MCNIDRKKSKITRDNPENAAPPCHPFCLLKTLSKANLSITFEGEI